MQYGEKYPDFGPPLAAEKLREIEGIAVGVSTVIRRLMKEGLWQGWKPRSIKRSRRERQGSCGELVQFAGSHYRWFERRGPFCCLITMIDDATNLRLILFFEEETAAGAMHVLSL